MAEAVVFHYREADTPLHRLDPRIKLLTLLALTVTLVLLPLRSAAVIGGYACVIALGAGLPISRFRRELRVFLVLGTFIFLGRYASSDLFEALRSVMQFFTVVLLGLVLMDTTAPEDCASALHWALSFFSPAAAGRFSARLMLTLAFIPILFDSVAEVREARKARCEKPSKRPMRFLLSFLEQTFDIMLVKAEEISLALESRAFTGSMKPKPLRFHLCDLAAAAVTASVTAAALLI